MPGTYRMTPDHRHVYDAAGLRSFVIVSHLTNMRIRSPVIEIISLAIIRPPVRNIRPHNREGYNSYRYSKNTNMRRWDRQKAATPITALAFRRSASALDSDRPSPAEIFYRMLLNREARDHNTEPSIYNGTLDSLCLGFRSSTPSRVAGRVSYFDSRPLLRVLC